MQSLACRCCSRADSKKALWTLWNGETHRGAIAQIIGLEERFDLAKGWSLALREDKKDRFTLVRGDENDDWEETVSIPLLLDHL